MANPSAATGFRIKDTPLRLTTYFIPATDANAVFVGDMVALAGSCDPATGVACAAAGTAGDSTLLLGLCVGLVNTSYTNIYRPASTGQYIIVADHPEQRFYGMFNGTITGAVVGDTANLDVGGGGSVTTGISTHAVSSTVSNSSAVKQLRIDSIEVGADKTIGLNSVVSVLINMHALANTAAAV